MIDITTEDVRTLMRDIAGVRKHIQADPIPPVAMALEVQLAGLEVRRQTFIDQLDERGVGASDPRMAELRASPL